MLCAVLFDLGETLLEFAGADLDRCFHEGTVLAYEFLRERGVRLPSLGVYERRQRWFARYSYLLSRLLGRDFDAIRVLKAQCRRNGADLSPAEIVELAWRYYRPLSEHARLPKDVLPALEGLRRRGLRLALVSNTFVPGVLLDRHIERIGLMPFFPVRVYSCQQAVRKPHPRIFRAALDALGCPARRCLFVGDHPWQDVFGARRLGMIAVRKSTTGTRGHWPCRADYGIRAISELLPLVDRLAASGAVSSAAKEEK